MDNNRKKEIQSSIGEKMNEWEEHYSGESLDRQARQNYRLSRDFLGAIKFSFIQGVISDSKRILEFGCGTGELCVFLHAINHNVVVGQDIAKNAIEHAKVKYGGICTFTDEPIESFSCDFDLIVSSNTLEHFHDPHAILNKLFKLSKRVLLIIPYKDTGINPEAEEGGLHHVVTFDENSFANYRILAETKFKSNGWSNGSDPLQWVLVLEKV